MKLAFTTLGCPEWDMETIAARAVEYGYDGVDFRGYQGETKLFELPEFTTKIKETAARFADVGIEAPCLSSSAHVFGPTAEKRDEAVEEVKAYAEMCGAFGASYIRVFGGGLRDTPRDEAIAVAGENLQRMAEVVKGAGVQILVETHDSWLSADDLGAVVSQADPELVGVLWDVNHPYRAAGDQPAETWAGLGKWVRNTHWKDSFPDETAKKGVRLCLMGEGDLPLAEMFACLKNGGYDGYMTLEWEKMWHPYLDKPEVAFPQYVKFMRDLIASA